MHEILRMHTASLQAMATRWAASAEALNATASPANLGFSWQPSTTAVNAAHAEVTVFATALATRVSSCATHVAEADTRYLANEAQAANRLASVVQAVTSV
ncbi:MULTISPECIES: hypothetical protein [unclassified Mycobacterium]|uniref:hypothetical protein n=1 Tax=unclassified Mycobacterium TaxID=2642494 RepID=UPI001E4E00E7|nr:MULTISPECIES: hypothetical protein [unclassified Mycobacterium]